MKVRLKNKRGDWSKTEKWLKKNQKADHLIDLMKEYGRKGVAALSSATPVDTGETASSWDYKIIIDNNDHDLHLCFVNNHETYTEIPIVFLIQYGHANQYGKYIRGRDFINPAIQPIFDELEERALKEISK